MLAIRLLKTVENRKKNHSSKNSIVTLDYTANLHVKEVTSRYFQGLFLLHDVEESHHDDLK